MEKTLKNPPTECTNCGGVNATHAKQCRHCKNNISYKLNCKYCQKSTYNFNVKCPHCNKILVKSQKIKDASPKQALLMRASYLVFILLGIVCVTTPSKLNSYFGAQPPLLIVLLALFLADFCTVFYKFYSDKSILKHKALFVNSLISLIIITGLNFFLGLSYPKKDHFDNGNLRFKSSIRMVNGKLRPVGNYTFYYKNGQKHEELILNPHFVSLLDYSKNKRWKYILINWWPNGQRHRFLVSGWDIDSIWYANGELMSVEKEELETEYFYPNGDSWYNKSKLMFKVEYPGDFKRNGLTFKPYFWSFLNGFGQFITNITPEYPLNKNDIKILNKKFISPNRPLPFLK